MVDRVDDVLNRFSHELMVERLRAEERKHSSTLGDAWVDVAVKKLRQSLKEILEDELREGYDGS